MTWSGFYLSCFLVGFALSVLSFLAGAVHLHLPARMHWPFHAIAGKGPAGRVAAHSHVGGSISWLNASTMLAFLAWFGGTGYILAKNSRFTAAFSLLIASTAGLAAGWLLFKFMAKIVKMSDAQLNDWDYRMEGSLGTLSIAIRENGTGEVIFEQNGARKSVGARTENGQTLPQGTEVVISRYESGIAFVRRWEEFAQISKDL